MPKRHPKISHPYEIHLTVSDVSRAEFVEACAGVNVKPVMLELQSRSNGILADVMTSSTINGTRDDAMAEMMSISFRLQATYGMAVTRYKLETVPWNPEVTDVGDRLPSQYFECHMALHLPPNMTAMQIRDLTQKCAANKLHLSRNVFKDAGEYVVHMATLRDHTASRQQFETDVSTTLNQFSEMGIVVGKHHIEFALLDTNPHHDRRWME